MAQVGGDDEAYEDRLVILEDLGIEENALEHDEFTDEVSASTDEAAVRRFFARAFQEWPTAMSKEQPKKSSMRWLPSLIATTNKKNRWDYSATVPSKNSEPSAAEIDSPVNKSTKPAPFVMLSRAFWNT